MAKMIFEELGGTYIRQGDYFSSLSVFTRRKRNQAYRRMGAAAFALSQTAPQGALYQPAYKRQAEQLSCGY